MLAMGLSLSVSQIVEPLRNARLVVVALVLNFIAVPLIAVGIDALLSLDDGLYIGLILMATAAGAPFLPKLGEAAKGNIPFSVGLMVLLMVVTVVYMPIVVPLLISGVEINPWDIASSLIFLMLLPLGIGLFMKWRYKKAADGLQPAMAQTSTVAIAILLVTGVIVNFTAILDIIGTGGFIAILLFLVGAFILGYFGAGKDAEVRSVLGLGTAQRNLSAAMVVAGQNFASDPEVLTFIIVAGIVGLLVLMPLAGELGRRSADQADS
ncbi:MAG: bile acid:sodium symporter family protein [Acidobacteria bacterium]|nr:bile acid:sodium symporter family protein [Acidobacteriota bacterium]